MNQRISLSLQSNRFVRWEQSNHSSLSLCHNNLTSYIPLLYALSSLLSEIINTKISLRQIEKLTSLDCTTVTLCHPFVTSSRPKLNLKNVIWWNWKNSQFENMAIKTLYSQQGDQLNCRMQTLSIVPG